MVGRVGGAAYVKEGGGRRVQEKEEVGGWQAIKHMAALHGSHATRPALG
jgi:hypothetical protein